MADGGGIARSIADIAESTMRDVKRGAQQEVNKTKQALGQQVMPTPANPSEKLARELAEKKQKDEQREKAIEQELSRIAQQIGQPTSTQVQQEQAMKTKRQEKELETEKSKEQEKKEALETVVELPGGKRPKGFLGAFGRIAKRGFNFLFFRRSKSQETKLGRGVGG